MPTLGAGAAFEDDGRLQEDRGRDAAVRSFRYPSLIPLGVRLAEEDGQDRRRVDGHFVSPRYVIEEISMLDGEPVRRPTGWCSVARWRATPGRGPRRCARRLSRSKRSLSASVIAPVIVSPVRRANSPASRQVSSFVMLRLTEPS